VDRIKRCSDARWDVSVTFHVMIDAYAFIGFPLSNSDVDVILTCMIHEGTQPIRVRCGGCRIILLPYVVFKMLLVRL
jgi:hypothetical protein